MAKPGKNSPWLAIKNHWPTGLLVVGAFLYAFSGYIFGSDTHQMAQTDLLQKAREGQVAEVAYKDDTHLIAKLKGDAKEWNVTYPKAAATDTFKVLSDANVPIKPAQTKSLTSSITSFATMLFWLWLIGKAIPLVKGGVAKLKKSKGVAEGSRPTKRLSDVRGLPEVTQELSRIASILKDPARYDALGARPPAGLVLYGPPGVGKTLLARALAGEAGVPFYEVTGSAIRSKWIGDSAKAIRDCFEQARQHPVSLLFFDEGETLAGKRGSGGSGGDQEHRATVNELLAQMNPDKDGGWVFVVIATNHPDMLDDALTRPGRVDLSLMVTPPDVRGRREILDIHTKGKPLGDDVDREHLALETYAYTGAGLETLINNAALAAGARDSSTIDAQDFEQALTLMRTGPALTSRHTTEEDRRVTAHHEAGHTLCMALLPKVANPTTVTILQHGQSGGHTMAIPDEEKASKYSSLHTLKQELAALMGGVAGEKFALDADFTNGAASDRERATHIATQMVCRWGMGTYNAIFDSDWQNGPHADEVWRQIEALLDEAERAAIELLLAHKPAFDRLVAELLEKETLRGADLRPYLQASPVDDECRAELAQRYSHVVGSVQARTLPASPNGHQHNLLQRM